MIDPAIAIELQEIAKAIYTLSGMMFLIAAVIALRSVLK